MSWLWLLPPVCFGVGAVAVAVVARDAARVAEELTSTARELGRLRAAVGTLRADLTDFTDRAGGLAAGRN